MVQQHIDYVNKMVKEFENEITKKEYEIKIQKITNKQDILSNIIANPFVSEKFIEKYKINLEIIKKEIEEEYEKFNFIKLLNEMKYFDDDEKITALKGEKDLFQKKLNAYKNLL